MRIVNNNGQFKLTLPKDLVLDKKWEAGDIVRFVEDSDGRVYLKLVKKKKSEVSEDDAD